MPNPVVVFFTDDMGKAYKLIKSLDHFGWPYRAVNKPFRGWKHRLESVLYFAETELSSSEFTHMIHVDAFDVLALRENPACGYQRRTNAADPSKNLSFQRNMSFGDTFSHDLVISTEIGCWPEDSKSFSIYQEQFATGMIQTPWRFPHSQFMVNLKSISKLQDVGFGVMDGFEDDQLHMNWVWDNFSEYHSGCDITLDTNCGLVQSIAFSHPWDSYFESKILYPDTDKPKYMFANKLTKTAPYFAHGNGKTDMSWIENNLETLYKQRTNHEQG